MFLWQYCDFLYKEGKVGFLKTALYYYRKGHNSSTSNFLTSISNFLLLLTEMQKILSQMKSLDLYFQNFCLYQNFWIIKKVINNDSLLSIDNQKQEYLDKLKKVFYYINTDVILNFNLVGCWFYSE